MCHESMGRFGEQVAQKESFLQIFYCSQLLSQSKSPYLRLMFGTI
jgi:hypothetical protein